MQRKQILAVVLVSTIVVVSVAFLFLLYIQTPASISEFVESTDQLRLDLKYGHGLDEEYQISVGESSYSLSPPQLLKYTAEAMLAIDGKCQFSIDPLAQFTLAGEEEGDFDSCLEVLSVEDYINLASDVREEMILTGKAPGSIQTSIGKIRFRDALFTFSRILDMWKKEGALPDEIIFLPAPSDNLIWEGVELPANHAYFLLPSTEVVTHSERVDTIISEVVENVEEKEEIARRLCEWTSTHIRYEFIVGQTSEDVLEGGAGQCGDFTNVYLALTRSAGIPAKRVSGRIIYTGGWSPPPGFENLIVGTTPEGETICSHAWAEVFLPENGWIPVEPQGRFGELPYRVYQQLEEKWTEALAAYETAYGSI